MSQHKPVWRAFLCLVVCSVLVGIGQRLPLQAQDPEEYSPLGDDVLIRPPLPGEFMLQDQGGPPGYTQTSDYMAGKIAVGIVLPESNGAVDPSSEDWTDAQIAEIRREVEGALEWWTEVLPDADLSFTYELRSRVPTAYEPVAHVLQDEGLWISDVMDALGHHGTNHFEQVIAYLSSLRQTHDADWAFTVFIANSAADGDGAFEDHRFAYAYFGGPFVVLTYDCDGYGIGNMDGVLAHEIGHTFWALDQYPGGPSCDISSGYLDVPNHNSQYNGSCPLNVPSIMRGGTAPYTQHAVDAYAQGQVGYWDSDGDGLPDPLDTTPEVTLAPASPIEGGVSYLGSVDDVPWSSSTRPDATINTIVDLRYRVDGGAWQSAIPVDGQYDTCSEAFAFSVLTSEGTHSVEVQAVNSVGNLSDTVSDTVFIAPESEPTVTPTPTSEPPTPTLTAAPSPLPPTSTPEPPILTATPIPPVAPTHTPQPPTPTQSSTVVPVTPTVWSSLTPTPVTPTATATWVPHDSGAGVEINAGAEFTNQPMVALAIRPPTEPSALTYPGSHPLQASGEMGVMIEQPPLDTYQIEVSNYPQFSPASLLPLSLTTMWSLDREGPSGVRTVYIRFVDDDGRYSVTYEDSILLDEQAPTGSVAIQTQDEGVVLLHLDAQDDLSGVDQMQLALGEDPQSDSWIRYQSTYALPLGRDVWLQVRYRDAAGNVSETYRGLHPARLSLRTHIPLALGNLGQ